MEERKYTAQELEDAAAAAVEAYKKESDVEAKQSELEAKLAEANELKQALETDKEAFETAKAEFEENKGNFLSLDEHKEKLEGAVAEAVTNVKRFHDRVAKFTEAGITLDDVGLQKLETMADEECDWFFNTIVANKSEASSPPDENKEESEETTDESTDETEEAGESPEEEEKPAEASAQVLNETPPVGLAGVTESSDIMADIEASLKKKIHSYG